MKRINWAKSKFEYPSVCATSKQKAAVKHIAKALNIKIDIESEIITKADANKFINECRKEFDKK